jgi:hypothetical protein
MYVQAGILAITAWIVWKYTKETQRLRQTAHCQVEVSREQVKVSQEQIETMQRPFIVVDPVWQEGCLDQLKFRNVGNSAAVNIVAICGENDVKISIIEKLEEFSISVQEDTESRKKFAQELEEMTQGLKNESEFTISNVLFVDPQLIPKNVLFVDPQLIPKGINLRIKYDNVAMMQYYTDQEILRDKVIIKSPGRFLRQ